MNIGWVFAKVANNQFDWTHCDDVIIIIIIIIIIDFKICCFYVILVLLGSVETQLGWSGKFC